MNCVKIVEKRKPILSQRPEPQIAAPDDVKIRIRYAAVNADDYHIFNGNFSSQYFNNGLGHEFSGEIVDLGEEAKLMGLKAGQQVSGVPFLPCGKCPTCLSGRFNICMNTGFYNLSGTFSEYIMRKDRQVVRLPGVTPEEASLFWLVMACVRCVERLDVRPGQRALILGGGSAGLILLQLIARRSLSAIAVTEPVASKRHLATELGATHVAHPNKENLVQWANNITNGLGFDLIIDASDNVEALSGVTTLLARGGSLMLFSFYDSTKLFSVNLAEMYYKEYSIYSSFASSYSPCYQNASSIMLGLRLFPLIGKVFPIRNVTEALLAYESRQYTRILIQP